jgi:hypothetical protein
VEDADGDLSHPAPLRMKESDSITAHLNDYEGIISQLSAQGMTIDDELKALLLMSSLPPS